MEKKIPVKTLYLLLVIAVGLVVLGVGSTYAIFTTSAEIVNPINFNSYLIYDSDIIETLDVNVPSGKIVTANVNITNSSGNNLNYTVWYLDEGLDIKIGTSDGVSTGSLNNGKSTTLAIRIKNNSSNNMVVTLGLSSSSDDIILGSKMIQVPSESFYSSTDFSYDNSETDVDCNDVTCMLNTLYSYTKGEVSLGDYVYYEPVVETYMTDPSKTGFVDPEPIRPELLKLWRVLFINDDGTVDLISENVSGFGIFFCGLTGYQNLVGYLNVLASQYETEGITVGSRHFGYNGQTEYITDTSMITGPVPWDCSTGTDDCDPAPVEKQGGGDTLYTRDYNQVQSVLKTSAAAMLESDTASNYWVASRFYDGFTGSMYSLKGRFVNKSGKVTDEYLYVSDTQIYEECMDSAIRPIVTVRADAKYMGAGTLNSPMRIVIE